MTEVPSSRFDTQVEHSLACKLLEEKFPYPLHDYVIEDLCKALDGIHILSVVQTGGSKLSYFSGYVLLLQELNKYPRFCKSIPSNPLMIVVYPTKGLEEEQVCNYHLVGSVPPLSICLTGIRVFKTRD
jgi:hypothetical protein